eukprot:g628.t1
MEISEVPKSDRHDGTGEDMEGGGLPPAKRRKADGGDGSRSRAPAAAAPDVEPGSENRRAKIAEARIELSLREHIPFHFFPETVRDGLSCKLAGLQVNYVDDVLEQTRTTKKGGTNADEKLVKGGPAKGKAREDGSDAAPAKNAEDAHAVPQEVELLPSAWVVKHKILPEIDFPLRPSERTSLDELQQVVVTTLRILKSLGTVVLITNAEAGWIRCSARALMPHVFRELDGVEQHSARSRYDTKELNIKSPFEWKRRTFRDEILKFYKPSGDGDANAASGDGSAAGSSASSATSSATSSPTVAVAAVCPDERGHTSSLLAEMHPNKVAALEVEQMTKINHQVEETESKIKPPDFSACAPPPRKFNLDHANLISIGDSAHEREAVIDVCKDLKLKRVKSLKLSERPHPRQLKKQHLFLHQFLQPVIQHGESLDLVISREPNALYDDRIGKSSEYADPVAAAAAPGVVVVAAADASNEAVVGAADRAAPTAGHDAAPAVVDLPPSAPRGGVSQQQNGSQREELVVSGVQFIREQMQGQKQKEKNRSRSRSQNKRNEGQQSDKVFDEDDAEEAKLTARERNMRRKVENTLRLNQFTSQHQRKYMSTAQTGTPAAPKHNKWQK